ncbi:MAG TPA: alpha/beta fold hydrolase [Anaerolineae bacterium]|nr:alpha/beta fold hydrolase [Anaerolineae bacterium]
MRTIQRRLHFYHLGQHALLILLVISLLLVTPLSGCRKKEATPAPKSQVSMPVVGTEGKSTFQSPTTRAQESPGATEVSAPRQATVKDVTLTTEDEIQLAATYYSPPLENAPGVVLLHMVDRQRQDWDRLARQLQANGFAALAVDFRGHGKSQGKKKWGEMTKDAAAAYAWLAERPEVDGGRIGLIGASIGANIALNFAARQPGVRTLVLLSPGLEYRGVKTEEAIKQYGARPVFIAASKEDKYATQSAGTLDALAQNQHHLQIYENQGHGTRMLGKGNGLEELILQRLKKTL